MTTLIPRPAYTTEELSKLYPPSLELKHVQIILRHGERTPVKARFQNAGLHPHWPYCSVAQRMLTTALTSSSLDGNSKTQRWDSLPFRRHVETLGPNDLPVRASGPAGTLSKNSTDSICFPGELTDIGRATTLALGQRLRHLYVDQLRFLPASLSDTSSSSSLLYIRSTPIPRALESTQQALVGLYPPGTWSPTVARDGLPIIARNYPDENLVPNEPCCARFRELAALFANRAAERFNSSPDMAYLNKSIGQYLTPVPQPQSQSHGNSAGAGVVKVDGKPRLSGIMDTINATLAHRHLGPGTELPAAFYDDNVRAHVDKIVTEEWFAGYRTSREYRMLGIGGLMADMTRRALWATDTSSSTSSSEKNAAPKEKLCLAGAHDTTIAAVLASLGVYPEGSKWPRFTSHVSLETFVARKAAASSSLTSPTEAMSPETAVDVPDTSDTTSASISSSSWARYLPNFLSSPFNTASSTAHRPTPQHAHVTPPSDPLAPQTPTPRDTYIRLRYNDLPLILPGCRPAGRHLDGDASFCTLDAFRRIVDEFNPSREEGGFRGVCSRNLGKGVVDEGRNISEGSSPVA